MTAHEKALVAQSQKWCMVDEVRHNLTAQRRFEQAFLSIDCPDENGKPRDFSDGGRHAEDIYRQLDRKHDIREKWKLFKAALKKLKRHPELKRTLWAILLFREASEEKMRRFEIRRKIFFALNIKAKAYFKRRSLVANLLQISI